jgi:proliferating cell nuclear antigen
MELIIKSNDKAEQFVNIFQNIKLFCDTFNVEITKDSFYIQGMDPSHVSIFEIHLHNNWFDSYTVDNNVTIGLTSSIFPKILTAWSADHNILLSMSNEDHLDVSFEKIEEKKSLYNKYFEIPLINIDTDRLDIPEQEYTLDIEFDSKKFKRLIDELSLIGERVNMTCDENEINAKSQSLEGSMSINIPFDDIESYSIEENETIDITFSLKFLKNMCVYSKLSSVALIYITNGNPLQLKYSLDENSYVRFYVAPAIDDN